MNEHVIILMSLEGEGMKLRWLRPFIVLMAALIVSISNMVSHRPILKSLVLLLAVIIIFFIIGSISTRMIDRAMSARETPQPEQAEDKTEDGEPAGVEMEE